MPFAAVRMPNGRLSYVFEKDGHISFEDAWFLGTHYSTNEDAEAAAQRAMDQLLEKRFARLVGQEESDDQPR